MKFKKSLLIICLVICLFFMASVSASDATITATDDNLEIDQPTDEVIGVEEDIELPSSDAGEVLKADEQTFEQLNATINNNTDKDIYLNSDYKYTSDDGNFTGGIVIDRDVNIYGNGHTINGSNEACIFKITRGNVVFYNITFVNGNAGEYGHGGAINGGCKAINCTFKENQAYFGGAMFEGSAVNCTFTGNHANNIGGAMSSGCAVNCTFIGNQADLIGGAMDWSSAVNCTFTSNKADFAGDAMSYGYKVNCIGQDDDYFDTEDLDLDWDVLDSLTIYAGETLLIQLKNQHNNLIDFINYDVVIYKNDVIVKTYHCLSNDDLSLDLAVGTYTAELTVTYSGLDKPEPKNIKVTIIGKSFSELNKTINNNSNDVIYLDADYTYNSTADSAFSEGIVINRDVIIYGNGHTINGSGEARIFNVTGGNVVFYNITFVNGDASNSWLDSGGAINGDCKAINCTFKENHASFDGGAMDGGSAVDCTFINNSAKNGGAMDDGSAVNCSFTGNHANNIGGAMCDGSAVDCIFTGNHANMDGGAMCDGSAVNCSFSGNHANMDGGAMAYGSAVNCSFSGNHANDFGGAMAYGSAVNCSFSGNSAMEGGAMYRSYKVNCIGQDSDYEDTEELALHWDAGNFTTVYGSGETLPIKLMNQDDDLIPFINYDVVIYNDSGKVRTYHCLSNDDLSLDLLPGIYTAELAVTYPGLDKPEPTNIKVTIIGKSFSELNKTINNNSNDVIYLDADYTYNSTADSAFSEGIVINRDVIIYGNGHTINGSGEARIFQINGGNIVFYNITFVNGNASNNEEDSGGAINGNCKAINCTFKENHANNFGGAMFFGSAVNCSFSGNHADYSGGAMFGGSAVNCSFSGNHADEGGAMYGGSAVNCSFSGNSATSSGGAMDSVSAVNCSFSGNHADKGGAMFFGSAVNCSFSGNSADHDGGAMAYGSAVNCSFSGNSAYCGGAMYGGYKVDCIGQDSDFIDTGELVLHWEVDNFTTVYGSGEMLPIELRNQQRAFVDFINYDVVIYKEGVRIKTYHCLSNDYLSFDLPAGIYTAVLIVTYPNLDSIPYNISLTVNKSPSNVEVSAADVTYPDSVRVNVKSNVTAEYVVSVGGMNQTVNLVAGVGQEVIFTGLAANEDGYIVNVESENYTGLNYTVKVVVHKAAPTINVSAVDVSYPGDVVVSVKSDVNGTYIVKVGDKSQNVTLEANVTKNVTFTGLAANEAGYTINVTHDSENYTGFNDSAVVKIMKVAVKLTANAVTATYNVNKNLVITLKDSTGKALSGVKVTVNLNGAKTYTTDRNGQIKINVAKLVPKTYTSKVTFAGDKNYKASSADVKVTVKKAKAKIKAKKKTYKVAKKVKKFKITLKDNKGKPIKKAKVRLIVKKIKKTSKKKTSKSKENKKKNILKTNKKGKITFKINRNKKGKYMATVKFYGNKYYTKAIKKVKIKMK